MCFTPIFSAIVTAFHPSFSFCFKSGGGNAKAPPGEVLRRSFVEKVNKSPIPTKIEIEITRSQQTFDDQNCPLDPSKLLPPPYSEQPENEKLEQLKWLLGGGPLAQYFSENAESVRFAYRAYYPWADLIEAVVQPIGQFIVAITDAPFDTSLLRYGGVICSKGRVVIDTISNCALVFRPEFDVAPLLIDGVATNKTALTWLRNIHSPILGEDVEFAGFKKVINLTVIPVPGAAPHFCLSHPLGFAILGTDEFALFVKTWVELASPSRRDNIAITRFQETYVDYCETTSLSDFDSTTMATLGHDGDETIAWFEDDASTVCCATIADSRRDTDSLLGARKREGRTIMS